MKYAFMSFSCPDLTLSEMLAFAKKTGYDGIEPRLVAKHSHGIEVDISASARKAIKHQAEDSGIAIACVATSCKYADPETSKQNIDETLRAIDLAADIGSGRIRVFGGQLGENLAREAAIDLVAEALGSVAEHAAHRGIVVCMETHDDWCDPGHVAEVIKRVAHPAVAVNWDIMHPVRTDHATIDESFETLKPWIRHLHLHDANKQTGHLVPIGRGYVDHRRAVQLMSGMDYQGFLSGEWINWDDPYESHLPRELATLKGYEKE